MRKYLFFLLTISFLFTACKNELEDFDPGFEGPAYFPLAVGNSWEYQLDSVIFDKAGTQVDSVSVFMRETLTERFVDNEGHDVFRIERSIKDNEGADWEIRDIWSTSMTDRTAFRNEENLRFAKLNFPIIEGKSWDGNAYFDSNIEIIVAGEAIRAYQNWGDYTYSAIDQNEEIGGQSFQHVCTVDQVDQDDILSRRYSQEKYARDIGLIYKKMIILNTQKIDSQDPWEEKAEEGFILEQKLISFTPG